LDFNQSHSQAGFRKGYSTMDHIHTISQIIEKSLEYQIELHFLYVDFQKAYDSIDHNSLWESMVRQGGHSKIIKVIRNLYQRAEAYLRIEKDGQKFKMKRGG